jgi:hypothetical protein
MLSKGIVIIFQAVHITTVLCFRIEAGLWRGYELKSNIGLSPLALLLKHTGVKVLPIVICSL